MVWRMHNKLFSIARVHICRGWRGLLAQHNGRSCTKQGRFQMALRRLSEFEGLKHADLLCCLAEEECDGMCWYCADW